MSRFWLDLSPPHSITTTTSACRANRACLPARNRSMPRSCGCQPLRLAHSQAHSSDPTKTQACRTPSSSPSQPLQRQTAHLFLFATALFYMQQVFDRAPGIAKPILFPECNEFLDHIAGPPDQDPRFCAGSSLLFNRVIDAVFFLPHTTKPSIELTHFCWLCLRRTSSNHQQRRGQRQNTPNLGLTLIWG